MSNTSSGDSENSGRGVGRFHWRSFLSFSLFLSFIMISLSGIILYIAPPGRISRWLEWIMLGFNRSQWEDLHTLFSYLFIIVALFHIFSMNWKVFISHIRTRVSKEYKRKRELLFSLLIFAFIFIFTVAKLPPVYTVMDLGSVISDAWAEKSGSPPVPHAEKLTVASFAQDIFHVHPDAVVEKLRELGFEVEDDGQQLRDVAVINDTPPSEIYILLLEHFTPYMIIDSETKEPLP